MKTDAGLATSMPEPVKPLWRRIFGLPGSRAGKWSLWLGLGCILSFALMQALVISGQRGGDTFFDNLWLSLPALAALLFLLASAVLAAVAVLRQGERSLFSFLALLLGGWVLIFVAGEFVVPH